MNEEEMIKNAGPRPVVPEDRAKRVRMAVEQEWRSHHAGSRRSGWRALATAAAVLIGIALAVWIDPARHLNPVRVATVEVPGSALDAGGPVFRGEPIETVDGRAALRLDGGGSLRLDMKTELVFRSPRQIQLTRGAVYYDSVGSAEQIEILTNLGSVRDIGTQFEVRKADGLMTVRVREGEVEVGTTRAGAGTELRLEEGGRISRRSLSPDDPVWSWVLDVAPPFSLEGATLADLLSWAGRELGLRVRYAEGIDPQGIILHGSLQGLRPDQAIETVLPTTGLTARREGTDLIISR